MPDNSADDLTAISPTRAMNADWPKGESARGLSEQSVDIEFRVPRRTDFRKEEHLGSTRPKDPSSNNPEKENLKVGPLLLLPGYLKKEGVDVKIE